jgi:hypothetical protein
MAINFQCKCGKVLQARDEWAGKLLKCPNCRDTVQAPAARETITAGAGPAAQAKAPAEKKAVPASVQPGVQAKGQQADSRQPAPSAGAAPKPSRSPGKKTGPAAPLTPLEESWKKSHLLGANEFQIVWDLVVSAKGRGCTFYRPGSKETLGTSKYQDTLVRFIARLVNLAQFIPPWIEFRDEAEGTLFFLKVISLVNNRYDIYAPDRKELLGSLKTIFSLKLWLRLLDPEGNDVGEMVSADLRAANGKGSYFGFHVKSNDGRILGEITSTSFHLARFNLPNKGCKVNTGYVGRVCKEFADDPRARALVLAATWVANLENMGVRELDPIKA